jgi:hypothetical protein
LSRGSAKRQISSAASNSWVLGSAHSAGGVKPGQAWPAPNTVQATTCVPPTPGPAVIRLENSVRCSWPGPGGHRSAARQNAAVSSKDSVRPRSSPFGPRCRENPPAIGEIVSAVP